MEKEGLMVLEEDQKVTMVMLQKMGSHVILFSSNDSMLTNVSGSPRHQQARPLHLVPVQPQREGDQIYNIFVPDLK